MSKTDDQAKHTRALQFARKRHLYWLVLDGQQDFAKTDAICKRNPLLHFFELVFLVDKQVFQMQRLGAQHRVALNVHGCLDRDANKGVFVVSDEMLSDGVPVLYVYE